MDEGRKEPPRFTFLVAILAPPTYARILLSLSYLSSETLTGKRLTEFCQAESTKEERNMSVTCKTLMACS